MDIPQRLAEELRDARSIIALTGSGISAESGIPTFREAQTGLWARCDPQQLATPEAFVRDSKLVWEWYEWRRKLVGEAEPNTGHRALVELEKQVPEFTLVTQNVDGLHSRAGSRDVIELHGNILRTICSVERVEVDLEQYEVHPPICSNCGAPLRPDVVWFGEALPAWAMESASRAARKADLFFSIGTSSLVYPAAALPYEAGEAGGTVVEINPEDTPLASVADYTLHVTAAEVLPALVKAAFR